MITDRELAIQQVRRLSSGGDIDRSKPLKFTFNGSPYQGFAGDTVASALLANGIDVVGRSFKYSRPRGIMTAGIDEPNKQRVRHHEQHANQRDQQPFCLISHGSRPDLYRYSSKAKWHDRLAFRQRTQF